MNLEIYTVCLVESITPCRSCTGMRYNISWYLGGPELNMDVEEKTLVAEVAGWAILAGIALGVVIGWVKNDGSKEKQNDQR